ncbi:MAG: SBBP repeat-containing protein [Chloroflexi bacterium]|nr:SBBP repeat-containing protein [Chloroflexota bacterium]MBU1751245.1 SBBP repeat-containing protein [Chloroflexota bacterium]MBU1877786.1 SBBP repeat-containing protein [Chloroflexota bacterium]
MYTSKPLQPVLLVIGLVVLVGAMGSASAVNAVDEPHTGTRAASSLQAFGLTYQWHTFYGIIDSVGESRSVAVDAAGNVYIAGYTNKTWGSPLHAYSGDYDAMVMKLNNRGEYQWHTFYGASPTQSEDGDDEGAAIAVDAGGNVYVTGYSDRTWQGPGNAEPLNPHGGDAEYMFILKLASSGAYQWHTFYQPGRPEAIALDSARNVYVTGYSGGEWGTPVHSAAANGHVVVLKLDSNGAYQWHTYYGAGVGAGDEAGYGIVTDTLDNVYITGSVTYPWQGDGNVDPLHPFSGGEGYSTDIVVLKLSNSGTYQWHTFYGDSGTDDVGNGIAVDGNGAPYIAGESFSTWGSPLHAKSGARDMAVLKLNSSGVYQWNTFYGGNANDIGYGISVNGSGNAYITGASAAPWLGDGNTEPAHPHSGGPNDITVLKLNTNGGYQRHTFYGADGSNDAGFSIAVNSDHEVFITGLSTTTWQGAGGAAPLHVHSGNLQGDSFVLKLSDRVYGIYLPLVIR